MTVNEAPGGTEWIPCITCGGKGYTVFQGIKRPCMYCRGAKGSLHAGKLPVWDDEGNWKKKKGILTGLKIKRRNQDDNS